MGVWTPQLYSDWVWDLNYYLHLDLDGVMAFGLKLKLTVRIWISIRMWALDVDLALNFIYSIREWDSD